MKNGWDTRKLGEVATLQRGFDLPTQNRVSGNYPLVSSSGIIDTHHKCAVRGPGVVTGRSGSIGNVFFIQDDFWPLNTVLYIKDFHGNDPRFVFHLLNYFDLKRFATGTGVPTLNRNFVHDEAVLIPTSVIEQQRIVGILDEAIDGIATAQANTEKNLQNAHALFESHLHSVFTQRGKGWVVRKVSEIAIHSLGKMLDKAKNKGEPQPYLRNLNVRWFTFDLSDLLQMPFLPTEADKYTAVKGDVLICEGGYPGRAAIWNEDYPIYFQKALHRVRFHEPEHSKWFVYYLYIQDASGELTQHFSGTGIQHFTGEVLARFPIPLPPVSELSRAVAKLDELAEETQRLASIYERKLAALDALKKSLLHQAFTGKLTKDSPQPFVAPLLPFLPQNPSLRDITPINLHAGILAIGYLAFEQAKRQWHFGHVVAEKLSHMTEAMAGIDLGRNPVQDHFGPDDNAHFHKVRHRARMANYFTFREGTRGNVFVKGRGFDSLAAKTRAALGDLNQKVDAVFQLMLPMDMERAEVFATVYAAWNNLLMEKRTPTDEEIVLAAREHWHPDKLKIDRDKFFKTIDWIRRKDICPQGKGKKVLPRPDKKRTPSGLGAP